MDRSRYVKQRQEEKRERVDLAQHTHRYTRIHAVGFMSTYLLTIQHRQASPVRCESAKRSHTQNLDARPDSRCERVLIIGTRVPATRPRTCVPVRTCLRACRRRLVDGWRWTLFKHVRRVLRRFPRKRSWSAGKYIWL